MRISGAFWAGMLSCGLVLEAGAAEPAAKSPATAEATKSPTASVQKSGNGAKKKGEPVPSNLQLLKNVKKTWAGVSCTGQLAVAVGGESMLAAPFAIANQSDNLKWAVFVTPPAPCGGTVVLGDVKLGAGSRPSLEMGVPPGMVKGNQAATLDWKKIERKSGASATATAANLCSAQGQGDTNMFSMFATGANERPDARSWDIENPNLLKLEGDLKTEDPNQRGRYVTWLDKTRGYLPVKQQKIPEQGPQVLTTFEAKEVAPGRWLPVRWEVSGAGRPTMVGELRELRCDRPLPKEWFDKKSYPDVNAQAGTIKAIREKN